MSVVFLLFVLNAFADTAGQLFFKVAAVDDKTEDLPWWKEWAVMLQRPWVYIAIAFYCIEFCTWCSFLSQVDLSVGIMLGTFDIVLIMLGGMIFFKEKLTAWHYVGMTLISIGVALVGFGQQ